MVFDPGMSDAIDPHPAAAIRFLRRPIVRAVTGLTNDQIDAQERAGVFPRRVVIAPRSVGWVSAEIHQWQAERIAMRDDAAAMAAAYEARLPPGARHRLRQQREQALIEADAPT